MVMTTPLIIAYCLLGATVVTVFATVAFLGFLLIIFRLDYGLLSTDFKRETIVSL